MIDSHDYHNPFHPINQKEVEMYSEEQLLQEQLETLQTRYDEKVRHCLHLQSQLRRLAQIEESLSTFGTLTYEEQKEKQTILSNYLIMTLKEKFDCISCKDCDIPYCEDKCTMLSEYELNKLEQIAYDYAIEFAVWIDDFYYQHDVQKNKYARSRQDFIDGEVFRIKQLLEIFKKEKGL